MASWRQDARFAARSLRRSPAFAITAVAILAVGIGMSVAMSTVFRTVLIAKLPVRDQDRVAVMWTYRVPGTDFAASVQQLDETRRRATTMSDIAGAAHWGAVNTTLVDGDRRLSLTYATVTDNFFDVLGARAVIGHLFRVGEDNAPVGRADAPQPALNLVISHRVWLRDYRGDSSIIGRHLIEPLFQQQFTIIGVAPAGLDYPSGTDVWTPMRDGWRGGTSVIAIARLKPGATLASARDEYLALSNRVEPILRAVGAHAQTIGDTIVGGARAVIIVLASAVGLLLLITCLNVGNLLLLRASSRARELGLRRVLGASYGDIVRQLVTEAAVLAITGGALGFAIAAALLRLAPVFASRALPRTDELAIASAPLLGAFAVTTLSMLLFGVIPSLFIARASGGTTLRIDTHTGTETRRRRGLRQALVASQVALAMITLGGAALLAKSLERLERQDAGYVADHLAHLSITWDVAAAHTAPQLSVLALRIERQLGSAPGVTAVTPLVVRPLLGTGVWQVVLEKEGQTPEEGRSNPALNGDIVGPGFIKTFGVRVLRGRDFSPDDTPTSQLVMMVSEKFAQRYWPGENPIGKRLRFAGASDDGIVGGRGWRTVVGVVGDTHLRTIREASPMAYLPTAQGYWQGNFAIKTSVPIEAIEPALRTAIHDAGGRAELQLTTTMDQLLAAPLAEPRLSALVMLAFGIVALLLSAIGLYGVMASLVRDQTRDIGIRMALGASPSRVRDDVLGRAAVTIGIGAVVGVVGALASSRLISGLLYQVKPTDPMSLAAAAVVLLGAGVIAAYIPARRATKIDPASALRAD